MELNFILTVLNLIIIFIPQPVAKYSCNAYVCVCVCILDRRGAVSILSLQSISVHTLTKRGQDCFVGSGLKMCKILSCIFGIIQYTVECPPRVYLSVCVCLGVVCGQNIVKNLKKNCKFDHHICGVYMMVKKL